MENGAVVAFKTEMPYCNVVGHLNANVVGTNSCKPVVRSAVSTFYLYCRRVGIQSFDPEPQIVICGAGTSVIVAVRAPVSP